MDREKEIDRVLRSFHFDPFDVMATRTDALIADIKKEYRRLSLLCHPDKCKEAYKEKAQKAFAMLAKAKAELLEDDKRPAIDEVVIKARARIKGKKEMVNAKQRKEREKARSARAQARKSLIDGATFDAEQVRQDKEEEEQDKLKVDVTLDEDFDGLVKADVKELIIDREWKKRQMMKAAQAEEERQQKEKADDDIVKAEEKKRKEDWEEGRGGRVNSWRDFMTKGKKSKKRKLKMPKIVHVDDDKTFVRRPAPPPKRG